MESRIEKFKNRELKAKELFSIEPISKKEAYGFVRDYHYLGAAKFFASHSHGLFIDSRLVGVASFCTPQGIVALKSWFNESNQTTDILELTRLCMLPALNGTNATSYLLSGALRNLKKEKIRAVVTLADNSRHVGSIYQVCNFKYYGLTDLKSDFFSEEGEVNPRGRVKDKPGVWLPRTRKHRYCFTLDGKTFPIIPEQPRPSSEDVDREYYSCCSGLQVVHDKRFDRWYECPRCLGKIKRIK